QQEGASQAQQGDSDAASGTEPASTPAPTTDRGSDIPDTPFTGEESSAPEGGDSSQAQEEPTPSPQPESSAADSPYYRPEEDTGGEPQSSGPGPGSEPGE
ncbi:MAG TPA: hypothetical protein H9749_10140, partial [Candidatus Acutalibacter stercorigallinarum]|nr:hypothetical protein [Candidatus Acutalibacter stercorigallinarum]